jgi:hypothetical protein
MGPLKILIADDHPSVRVLLRNILESVPEWEVCGEAPDGSAAVGFGPASSPGRHCDGFDDAGMQRLGGHAARFAIFP